MELHCMWYSGGYDTARRVQGFCFNARIRAVKRTLPLHRPIMSWGHALKRTACMQRKPNVTEAGNVGKQTGEAQ
jgi:hypothetical protein